MPYKAKSDLTKAAIKKSFLALLNEKPINQISVRDIAEGCGFNRNTIYYHYDDIPCLVEEIVIETAEKIISDYSDYHSLEACIDKMAEFALEHKRTVADGEQPAAVADIVNLAFARVNHLRNAVFRVI